MEVEQLDAVRAAGQLAEVNGEVELVPGARVMRTGGHTRGSQAVLIGLDRPGGRTGDPVGQAVMWGDLIPTRWQIPTRWTSAFDDYPIDAIEVRNELLARAATEGWWSYFTHDPGDMPVRIQATDRGSYTAV
jgi:glyoxylase-like metal-dependent hydrolase (beta-lactamase superfamily II)